MSSRSGRPASTRRLEQIRHWRRSGYFVVDDPGGINNKAMRPVKTPDGDVFGYVYLLYNSSNGKNCVATIKTRFIGKPTDMFARLEVKNGGDGFDRGRFEYYAGPAKRYAAGKCVSYSGMIVTPLDRKVRFANGGRESWGNCR